MGFSFAEIFYLCLGLLGKKVLVIESGDSPQFDPFPNFARENFGCFLCYKFIELMTEFS